MSQPAKHKQSDLLTKNLITVSQNEAIGFAYERDHALLALPMGFGKTVVALTSASELIRDGVLTKVLIACPARVRDLVWSKEHLKWEHLADLDVTLYPDDSGQIVVTSFNQLKDALTLHYDGLIVDELTKLKTAGGAWFKSLRKYVDKFTWRLCLTGSLADEGLEHLYSMCFVVDGGKALGKHKDMFLEKYFMATDFNRYNWAPREGTAEKLAALIKPFTFQVETDDQDRPPLNTVYTFCDLPDSAREKYKSLCKEMAVTVAGEDIVAVNAAVLSGKLQQVCNGFAYSEEGYGIPLHDEKMGAARRSISKHTGQVMVVYQYKEELDRLRSQYPHARVLGDGVSRDYAIETEKLWNEGKVGVLLVHPASAGHGLNFQYGGNYLLFLGPIWSRDQTEQMIARLWRRGQRDAVTVEYLVARDSVEDHVIIPRVAGKGEVAEAFVDHLIDAGR